MSELNNSRKRWIDLVKGIGIILVIVEHWIGSGNLKISNYILSFHMPLFYIMGGVLYKSKPLDEIIYRKFQSLIIPLIIFELFNIFPQMFLSVLAVPYAKILSNILSIRGGWFLCSMFLTCIFFSVIEKNKKKILSLIIVCLYVLGLVLSNYGVSINSNIKQAFIGIFFYYLGYLFSNYDIYKYLKEINISKRVLILITSLALMVICYYIYNDFMVLMYMNKYGNPIVFTIKSLIISFCVILITIILERYIPIVDRLGKFSLLMMIFQFPIYLSLKLVIKHVLFTKNIIIIQSLNLICIILIISISYIASLMIDKYLPIMGGHIHKK